MTLPPDASSAALGRDGAGGTRPAEVWRSALRWLIVAAFVLRAVLSFFDAQAIAAGAVRTLPLVSSLALGSTSPLWPLVWGALSLVVGGALGLRIRIGWLLALAVTVAYLVSGIADVSTLLDAAPNDPWQAISSAMIGTVIPTAVLAGLISIRQWYLPSSRPLPHVHLLRDERHPGQPAVTVPTLDRWRRR